MLARGLQLARQTTATDQRETGVSKNALKIWRLLVPGILLLTFSVPVLVCEFHEAVPDPKNSLAVAAAIVLGALYDLFDLRRFTMSHPIEQIRKNIRRRLSVPFANVAGFERLDTLSDRDFLRTFYSIVDNDNSLTDQSNDIRLNGLYLSTACDLGVIAPFVLVSYSLLSAYSFWVLGRVPPCAIGTALTALLLWASSPALVRRATQEHLTLGDEQLTHITTRAELTQSLEDKLRHLLRTHAAGARDAH